MNDGHNIPLRVAFYIRVSTEDQVEKFGPEMQLETLEALIKSKGKFDDGTDRFIKAGDQYVYKEDGISGTIPLDERPAFSRLKEDILNAPKGKRPFDVVAVYKIDRFARRLKILLDVVGFFDEHEIQFISANESIDTSTPFGKAVLGIIGVIAELEIETLKLRTQDGRTQAIKQGVVMGSAAYYGYNKNAEKRLEVFDKEAEIVRLIFDFFTAKNMTLQQIATELKNREILTPDASAVFYDKRKGETKRTNNDYFWRAERVKKILENEIYIGKYYTGKYQKGKRTDKEKWELSPYPQPSLVDEYTFRLAEQKLRNIRQSSLAVSRQERQKHLYLLSGLLRCECCYRQGRIEEGEEMPVWQGEPRKVKTKAGETINYIYRCGHKSSAKFSDTCTAIPLPADKIEEIVSDNILSLLENPEPVMAYQRRLDSTKLEVEQLRKDREHYRKLLNALPARRERLLEQHRDRFIERPQLDKAYADLANKEAFFISKIEEIELRIGKHQLSKNYADVLQSFQDKYKQALDTFKTDRKALFDVTHALVDKVIVRTRPVTKDDVISGRKKPNQEIPYKLDIYFKLPQEMLQEMFMKFGVKRADL